MYSLLVMMTTVMTTMTTTMTTTTRKDDNDDDDDDDDDDDNDFSMEQKADSRFRLCKSNRRSTWDPWGAIQRSQNMPKQRNQLINKLNSLKFYVPRIESA